MKNVLLASLILAVTAAPASALADDRSELLTAFETTFSSDFAAKGSTTATAIVDEETVLTFTQVVQHINKNNDWESHSDLTLDFDASLLTSFLPSPFPAISGVLTLGSDTYYSFEDKYFWGRIRDLNLEVTQDSSDVNIKSIAEGWFELAKFFSDKYVTIDFEEALASITGDNPLVAELRTQIEASLAAYDDYGTFATDVLRISLNTGLFDITKSSRQYIMTLTEDAGKIRLQKFAELFEVLGMSDDDVAEIAAELEAMNARVREAWPEVLATVDFALRFNTSPRTITLIGATLNVQTEHEVTEFDGETWEYVVTDTVPIGFTMQGSVMVADRPGRVSFPAVTSVVDFTKFLKGLAAMLEMQQMFEPEPLEDFETGGFEAPAA